MSRRWIWLLASGWVLLPPAIPAAASKPALAKPHFDSDIKPLLAQYCYPCHGEKKKGGLDFRLFVDEAAALKDRRVFEKVLAKLQAHEMPPENKPQPSPAESRLITNWVAATFFECDCNHPDPGRVTIRRLNRNEYNNTIRDLTGVDFQPAADFPADDSGYGFDNIGDVLSLSPVLMEKYLAAAEKIVDAAMAEPSVNTTNQVGQERTPGVGSRLLRKMVIYPQAGGENDHNRGTPHPDPLPIRWGKGNNASVAGDKNMELDCARATIANFLPRAFRRPITADERERFLGLFQSARADAETYENSLKRVFEAALVSPWFLFRNESSPEPDNPHSIRPLNEYALASRLSYFLWSSMPDDELFAEAAHGTLHRHVEAQVARMLKDPRAHALVENFAAQWLQLRNLKLMSPDRKRFPEFDEGLRSAMQKETELFFQSIWSENRSVLDFIQADYTYVNGPLARLYGIPGIEGNEFRRVNLGKSQRGGLLTQASILTLTSNPTRTSPVKRGKWVLENILGAPPPPPPPNVPELKEGKAALTGSLRQRMEQHRSDPNCATCHERMDPIGFSFENFNAIGAWRDKDGEFAIDPSGKLSTGESFNGPAELAHLLLTQKRDDFVHCLTEKMLTYALGRGLEYYDKCAVDQITKRLTRDHYRFNTLILEIVKSTPFRMTRGEAAPGETVSSNN